MRDSTMRICRLDAIMPPCMNAATYSSCLCSAGDAGTTEAIHRNHHQSREVMASLSRPRYRDEAHQCDSKRHRRTNHSERMSRRILPVVCKAFPAGSKAGAEARGGHFPELQASGARATQELKPGEISANGATLATGTVPGKLRRREVGDIS